LKFDTTQPNCTDVPNFPNPTCDERKINTKKALSMEYRATFHLKQAQVEGNTTRYYHGIIVQLPSTILLPRPEISKSAIIEAFNVN